jgi:hypothetical protein
MSSILKLLLSQSPIVLGIVVGVIGAAVYFLFLRGGDNNNDEKDIEDSEEQEKRLREKGERIIKRSEVALHNEIDDLWVIVDNKVYDLTKFVDKHP